MRHITIQLYRGFLYMFGKTYGKTGAGFAVRPETISILMEVLVLMNMLI